MANILFVESKAINLDNVSYVDLDPYGNNSIGIVFVGSNPSDTYDLVLSGKEAEAFLIDLEQHKKQAV